LDKERLQSPWGKSALGSCHHLAHHCADVAACFEAIAALPVVRARMERAAGRQLSEREIARLAVLTFLHDVGKLHPGFQAKTWPPGVWPHSLHGHVREGLAIFLGAADWKIAHNLNRDALSAWGVDEHLLFAAFSHHGLPVLPDKAANNDWADVPAISYDPIKTSAEIGAVLQDWFRDAFVNDGRALPSEANFQHLFCGLVSLADWLGSDRRFFSFLAELDHGYMSTTRQRAANAIASVGLNALPLQALISGRTDFHSLTGMLQPRPAQELIGEYSLGEQLVILEAETGSGKTEAALWRFARLFEARRVDSMYFALPTRAAARQIHGRVNEAMKRLFGTEVLEVVLAVPGYLQAGDAQGQMLPDWEVHWDDDDGQGEKNLLARWAAENTKRCLAATVAVGTVDQAMLAALAVKHAHLRAAAVSRSLIVIDEVHASDRYMTEVQDHLLRMHLKRGGYAMLMSATLGSVARAKWLGQNNAPPFKIAVDAAYPAVWGKGEAAPHSTSAQDRQKCVMMKVVAPWSADSAGKLAVCAARDGARVLVIRNTVSAAVATFEAIRGAGNEGFLMQVSGGPALHHSRFASEDRQLLDSAVEEALHTRKRQSGGVIVLGTQTLEQSLDIDADFLVTDLCPVDVLLQRIGRLHRHDLWRPSGFEQPRCVVLVPEQGLERLTRPAFDNGLGMFRDGGGVYRNLAACELTRRLAESWPEWIIPHMNRFLVESATHPEKIEALHRELGKSWEKYWNDIYGRDVADAGAAKNVALPVDTPFADAQFPNSDEKIRTRLGADGAKIAFVRDAVGPFGNRISSITLPAYWSHEIGDSEPITPDGEGGRFQFSAGSSLFTYDRRGLQREKS
jgi:CRISPR-associated endonuclease/helicase Cas3